MTDVVTFPEWRDRALDDVLYHCRELLDDVDYPTVRRWRAISRT